MTASEVPNPNLEERQLTRQTPGDSLTRPQAFACTLALLFSVLGSMVGVPFLSAGVASHQTERVLNAWSDNDSLPPPSYWEQLHQRAIRAAEGYPVANGEYLDRLGRVSLWGAAINPNAKQHWQDAIEAFRASVAVRPSWPWTWLRLAHAKLHGGQLDEEFDRALRQAARLGAGRADLNRDLARMGFDAWRLLSIEQRALVLGAAAQLARRSEHDASYVYEVASAAGADTALCWALDTAVKTEQRICKEEG